MYVVCCLCYCHCFAVVCCIVFVVVRCVFVVPWSCAWLRFVCCYVSRCCIVLYGIGVIDHVVASYVIVVLVLSMFGIRSSVIVLVVVVNVLVVPLRFMIDLAVIVVFG